MAADDVQALILRPGIDAVEVAVDEVQRAVGVDGSAAQRLETSDQLLGRGAWAYGGRVGWHIETRKLVLAHVQPMRHVLNRILVGKLRQPQKGCAVTAVTRSKAAFRIDVDIAEMNVMRAIDSCRSRRGTQRPGHAITMVVRHQDVMRVADLQRYRIAAFAVFFFCLGREQLPVGYPVQNDLIANMMLDRYLIDVPRSVGVRHIKARAGVSIGAPDTVECSTTAARHPQARILSVPASSRISIRTVIVVVGIESLAVREIGPVPAFKLHIIHEGALTRAPQQRGGSRVDTTGKQADPGDDRIAAISRADERLRLPYSLKRRCVIRQADLSQTGLQTNDHRILPQSDRVGHPIDTQRQIDNPVCIDRLLERHRIVCLAVTNGTRVTCVGPLSYRRQWPNCRFGLRRQRTACHFNVSIHVAELSERGDHEAVAESTDPIGRTLAIDSLATVPELCEHRGVAGQRILEADLGINVVFVGNDDAGPTDVLEPDILAPEPVAIAAVNVDTNRYIAHHNIDQRQLRLVLADGGAFLTVER